MAVAYNASLVQVSGFVADPSWDFQMLQGIKKVASTLDHEERKEDDVNEEVAVKEERKKEGKRRSHRLLSASASAYAELEPPTIAQTAKTGEADTAERGGKRRSKRQKTMRKGPLPLQMVHVTIDSRGREVEGDEEAAAQAMEALQCREGEMWHQYEGRIQTALSINEVRLHKALAERTGQQLLPDSSDDGY